MHFQVIVDISYCWTETQRRNSMKMLVSQWVLLIFDQNFCSVFISCLPIVHAQQQNKATLRYTRCFKCTSEVRINVITDYFKPSSLPLHRQIVMLSSTIFQYLSDGYIKVFNSTLQHLENDFYAQFAYIPIAIRFRCICFITLFSDAISSILFYNCCKCNWF